MKNKVLKVIFRSLGVIILVGVVVFSVWIGYFFFLIGGDCGNEVLESVNALDGSKKAVVFVRGCGATTDWVTQASVLNADGMITDRDLGNVLQINPNHGKAWPLARKGWSIIKPEWESQNSLILHYSNDSAVSSQNERVGDVHIKFIPITKEFAEVEMLEIIR